jgi:serine/threonine protein phosphatase PrpC
MGGHQAGEIAADLAIGHLAGALVPGRDPDGRGLVEAIERANAAIRSEARTRPELLGMGTTCTALVVTDVVTIAHVGDSRAYRSREGRLEQLTDDHSLVAAMVRDGRLDAAAAPTDARRHVITRALGAEDDVVVDLVTVDRQPGDRFLLCSDGIHGQVNDATIERVLADTGDPGAAADRLIELAEAAGGEDNATVIVIDPDRIAVGEQVDQVDARPVPVVSHRSRRSAAARAATTVIVALIGAVAIWLASGGLSPGAPVPSEAAPSASAPVPSLVAPSRSPASAGPGTSASPSIPTPSIGAPQPSIPGPS